MPLVSYSLLRTMSVKLLISPSYLNEILAGYSNLGCKLFSFITLSMSCHSLLASRVSIERSADLLKVIFMGIPLCVICCFSLAAFNICSLCLIFVNLINMCLGVFHLEFILFGTLWVSWTWVIVLCGLPWWLSGKESACSAGAAAEPAGSIPGLGRSPGGGHSISSILAWRIPWTEEPSRL